MIKSGRIIDSGAMLRRYGYFKPAITALGKYHITENPTVKELKLKRGLLQTAYVDIDKYKFEGNVIDYLCFISTSYILYEYRKSLDRIYRKIIPGEYIDEITGLDASPVSRISSPLAELFQILTEDMRDGRNMTRLFLKEPNHVFISDTYSFYAKLLDSVYEKEETLNFPKKEMMQYLMSKVFLCFYLTDCGEGEAQTNYEFITLLRHDVYSTHSQIDDNYVNNPSQREKWL